MKVSKMVVPYGSKSVPFSVVGLSAPRLKTKRSFVGVQVRPSTGSSHSLATMMLG